MYDTQIVFGLVYFGILLVLAVIAVAVCIGKAGCGD